MELSKTAELWTGYHQGVRLCQQGLVMNVETTCAAFHKRQPVLDFMQTILGKGFNQMNKTCSNRDVAAMNAAIANILVQVMHRKNETRKFRSVSVSLPSPSLIEYHVTDVEELHEGPLPKRRSR